MNGLLKSKIAAWVMMAVIIAFLCFTFSMRTVWWAYIDVFCAFMMAFCHLLALNFLKISVAASRKLDNIAIVFGILFVIAFLVEYMLLH